MEKQIDICATCVHDEPGYCSVIGTIPHCCSRHWHCRKKVKPMFGKRKLELLAHTARIKELEEILCPCEQHDWISNGYHFSGGTGRGDETTIYHYICKRCKKRMQSIQPYLGSDSDGR